jgi:hypothetical protein
MSCQQLRFHIPLDAILYQKKSFHLRFPHPLDKRQSWWIDNPPTFSGPSSSLSSQPIAVLSSPMFLIWSLLRDPSLPCDCVLSFVFHFVTKSWWTGPPTIHHLLAHPKHTISTIQVVRSVGIGGAENHPAGFCFSLPFDDSVKCGKVRYCPIGEGSGVFPCC